MNKFFKVLAIISLLINVSLFAGPAQSKPTKVEQIKPAKILSPNEQLLEAAESGDVDQALEALNAGADINTTYVYVKPDETDILNDDEEPEFPLISPGDTPLNVASRLGHTDIVRLLLERGADMEIPNDVEATPLAVAKNNNIVKLLLEFGADINHEYVDRTYVTFLCDPNFPRYNMQIITAIEDSLKAGADVRSALQFDNDYPNQLYHECIQLFQPIKPIQDQIDAEINSELTRDNKALQIINQASVKSKEFQMVVNYILNKIKTEKDQEELSSIAMSNIRRILITIANRLAKIYAKHIDKTVKDALSQLPEKLEKLSDSEYKEAVSNILKLPEELGYPLIVGEFVDRLAEDLKKLLPFTNFNQQIPLKDGAVVSFGFLILREVASMLPLPDSDQPGPVC